MDILYRQKIQLKDNTDSLKTINDNELNNSHLLYLTLLSEPVGWSATVHTNMMLVL